MNLIVRLHLMIKKTFKFINRYMLTQRYSKIILKLTQFLSPNNETGYYKELYGKHDNKPSVLYRQFENEIWHGRIPNVLQEIICNVPGEKILELGCGEGVLTLCLSSCKEQVIGIDITPIRYNKAQAIKDRWQKLGIIRSENCRFILGDIFNHTELFDDMDTLVARRVIYYFQEDLQRLMSTIQGRVQYLCFIGNPSRAIKYMNGQTQNIGKYAYFSTVEGMKELMNCFGYQIIFEKEHPEPIVVGKFNNNEKFIKT